MFGVSRIIRVPVVPVRLFSTTTTRFSGHSKWSTIKHDKAKNDGEKNKIANKVANMIAVAAKLGGSDPGCNVRLSAAIEQATKNNVPKRVVENAIKRGLGNTDDKKNVEQTIYEGMGPGGVSLVVEALTDNKARTVGLVRSAFVKSGGSVTPTLFQFDRKGMIVIEKGDLKFDDIFEKVLEYGVEDVEDIEEHGIVEIYTDPSDTNKVSQDIQKDAGYKIKEVSIVYIPKDDMLVEIQDEDTKIKWDKFIKQLEEITDVTDYYHTLKEE